MATGPFDALDAVTPSRVTENFELVLVVRLEDDPPVPASPWPDLTGVAADQRAEKIRTRHLRLVAGGHPLDRPGHAEPAPEQPADGPRPDRRAARPAPPPGRRGRRPRGPALRHCRSDRGAGE